MSENRQMKTGHALLLNHTLNLSMIKMLQLSCSAAAALSEKRYVAKLS